MNPPVTHIHRHERALKQVNLCCTAFEPDTLAVLQTVLDKVCADYSVTDDAERTEAARRMIQTAMNGVVDPERLTASAVAGLFAVRKSQRTG